MRRGDTTHPRQGTGVEGRNLPLRSIARLGGARSRQRAQKSVIVGLLALSPMLFDTVLAVLVAVVIIVVAVVVGVAFVGRGKKLKCPDCGTVFSAPLMDNKFTGLGWTLPYLGRVKCHKCGESRSRRDYQKVSVPSQPLR